MGLKIHRIKSLGQIIKKRELWARYDEPVGRRSRVLAVREKKGFMGNSEIEDKFTEGGNEFRSQYPGRYMILISEAEFNKRFRVQVGIPPGGRLIKGQSRKMVKKKNQEGRILKKYNFFLNEKGMAISSRRGNFRWKLRGKAGGWSLREFWPEIHSRRLSEAKKSK
jgi:hypothetical protein